MQTKQFLLTIRNSSELLSGGKFHYQIQVFQTLTNDAFFPNSTLFGVHTGAVGMTYKSLFGETQSATLHWIFCHRDMLDMTCVTRELT